MKPTVGTWMTANPYTIGPEDSADQLVGMFTETDALRALLSLLREQRN